ncbi:N-acetylmuramoyl-L-alanine amidase family protein [Mesobacillus zeae]|uniref:N-acetylmuramoyl-L-alanine amidase n=1 Tax=Mesobacillus zeae TaxID=1917180 RepID=A0A398BGS3_9BACI|nr:N-acetylmuramoyl-L-alanine amidase [Mesobacillus zeae]RID88927.1 N-acetylmuramoyl-L-alanine amidase [Mesobacillus zeae]
MSDKCINDAGHGGTDPGACANGIKEKEYSLEAALYVNKRLNEHGITSGLTRPGDETLDSGPRTKRVRDSNAEFGISHHFNAGGGAGAEFIHSIFSDGEFGKLLAEEFKKAGYPVRRTFSRQGNNGKDYYFMHRETGRCNMTIVEYDFVDGPNADKLKDKAYRHGMYECVVKAVCRHEGVKYYPIKPQASKPKPNTKPEKVWYDVVIGGFDQHEIDGAFAATKKAFPHWHMEKRKQ